MEDWAVWIDPIRMTETLRVAMHAGCAAVSPDLTRIAVGNARPFLEPHRGVPPVAVFDATDPTWHEHESRRATLLREGGDRVDVNGVAFSPDGTRLVVSYALDRRGGYEFVLALLPLTAGKACRVPAGEADDRVYPVLTFSPDGERLAATGGIDGDRDVVIVNPRTARRVTRFLPPGSKSRHLAYSPDGRSLAVANGKCVFLHPADSDEPRFALAHPKQTNGVAFTPHGRRLLSTCHDGPVRIWDGESGQLVTSYDWGIGQTTAVAVSPDGLTAAAAGRKGQIAVFDLDA